LSGEGAAGLESGREAALEHAGQKNGHALPGHCALRRV
jgi:hypothetical protein